MANQLSGVTVTAAPLPPDVVTVKVNGVSIGGWTDVRVTAGIETVPRVFKVGMTAVSGVPAKAGDVCQVFLGKNAVVTGHIDIDTNGGDASGHTLSLTGRGNCADLVDCSAEWPSGQISGTNALDVASKLAEPYGIAVSLATGTAMGRTADDQIPQFNLNYGETAWAIIERVCAAAAVLAYEDETGSLVLSDVGVDTAASGFVYGQNVLAWDVANSLAQRYSDYACSLLPTDPFGAVGQVGPFFKASDGNVPRHRLLWIVAEQIVGSQALCERRALWEAARRFGRGSIVKITADSWRDSGGALWTPNTLVKVSAPGMRMQGASASMVIAEVTYVFGPEGTSAEVTLMPPTAFQVLQIPILPVILSMAPLPSGGG